MVEKPTRFQVQRIDQSIGGGYIVGSDIRPDVV
jgi:hypothetical protein